MKKSILENWLLELRSAKYLQCKGGLRIENSYCPLGILCEISKLTNWEVYKYNSKYYEYFFENKYLPKRVAEWAGMPKKEADAVCCFVIALNDQGLTFDEIANILEGKFK